MGGAIEPGFVMGSATKPFTLEQLAELGLASGKPFYTLELAYLWGRLTPNNGILFGAGRIVLKNWRDIEAIDVATGEPVQLYARLQQRVRNLHPVLREAEVTHYWGGAVHGG